MTLDPASLTIISVDDHLVEPPDMFEGRLAAKFAERAPRVVERADGREMWLFEGVEIPNFGLNAVSGRPQEEYGIEPTRFDEIRRGCWDREARIDDMNAGGILASLNFPSFPQFCGQIFANTEDKELALAVLQAYNDWHIEEWAGGRSGPAHPPVPRSLLGPRCHGRRGASGGGPRRASRHMVRESGEDRGAQFP